MLINPADAASTQATLREVEAAGRAFGLQIDVHNAGSRDDIDAAFAALMRDRADAVFIAGDAFLNSRRLQLALLAARHAVPAIVWFARLSRIRRADELWHERHRRVPPGRRLCRPHPQGREAGRPAGACSRPSSSW